MTTDPQSTATTDILDLLAEQRSTFLITFRGLDDAGARTRSTASELTLIALLKHVTGTERGWIRTLVERDEAAEFDMDSAMQSWTVGSDETLEALLADYVVVARETEAAVRDLDLTEPVPLPTAPWAPQRQWWSGLKILMHILRETAQHAGHADIIRESLDGANTTMQMGADAGMEI
ncbi:DinB family protein [Rhodococcus sp. NPDC058505]|uniref:DinB family protein n=1 Tax=unclassified Rhodococcus (in: high G+C Gram-positive bacteria) TaxID=192944 RepID=UPI003658B42C